MRKAICSLCDPQAAQFLQVRGFIRPFLPPQHTGPLAVSFRTGALRSSSSFSANQVRANFLNPASSSIQLGICADSFCKNLWDACGDDIANLGSLDLLGLNVRWRVVQCCDTIVPSTIGIYRGTTRCSM